jgi:hypothetical protein
MEESGWPQTPAAIVVVNTPCAGSCSINAGFSPILRNVMLLAAIKSMVQMKMKSFGQAAVCRWNLYYFPTTKAVTVS